MKDSLKKFLNYFKKKENREFHFLFSLVMVLLTIPLPKYSLNSQAIILFVIAWIGLNPLHEKLAFLKKNKLKFFILAIPFWIQVVGLFYTNDFNAGIIELSKQIPFLIFPLVFSTIDIKFINSNNLLNYFQIGVFVATLFAISKASFFLINNLGNFFYYDKFAIFLNKHTTYFSLFVVVSILICFRNLSKHRASLLNYVMLSLFSLTLYFLSVRISIIALAIGALVLIIFSGKRILKIMGIIVLPLLVVFVFSSPNFEKRFQPSKTEVSTIDDIDFRMKHWQAVIETVQNNSLLFGSGTKGDRNYLYNKYREYKLTSAYEEKYNAHNQFLEILLNHGAMGLLSFLFFLGYIFKSLLYQKKYFHVSIMLLFVIYMITESILFRHSGIVLFSLIGTVAIFCRNPDQINKLDIE